MKTKRRKPAFIFDIEAGGLSGNRSSIYSISYSQGDKLTSHFAKPVPGTLISNWSRKNVWDPIKKTAGKIGTEKRALSGFLGALEKQKGGTIAGWNIGYIPSPQSEDISGFDIPMIMTRAGKYPGMRDKFQKAFQNVKIRDIGTEYSVRLAQGLEKYPTLIDEHLYGQITGYTKQIDRYLADKPDAGIPEIARHMGSSGYKFSGWKQEMIHGLSFPGKKYAAHQSEADIGAVRELARAAPDFQVTPEFATAWNREALKNTLVSGLTRGARGDKAYKDAVSRADRFGIRDYFQESLKQEVTSRGGDMSAVLAGKGLGREGFSIVRGSRLASAAEALKTVFSSGQRGILGGAPGALGSVGEKLDLASNFVGNHKYKFGFAAAALGLYASKPLSLFNAKDDNYNTVEGLKHGGVAQNKRKKLTPFGSGWDPVRNLLQAGEHLEGLMASKEFKEALSKGISVGSLGKGGFGEAFHMKTSFRGQDLSFVRKLGRIGPNEVAAQTAAQVSHGPTVYSSSPGQIDMEMFRGKTLHQAFEDKDIGMNTYMEHFEAFKKMSRLPGDKWVHGDLHAKNMFLADTPAGQQRGLIDFGVAWEYANTPAGKRDRTRTLLYKGAIGVGIGTGLFALGNSITGLAHKGESGANRKHRTDFGSGYQGDKSHERDVKDRFKLLTQNLQKYGTTAGTGHKRLLIPKAKLGSEQDLEKILGFVPVTIAIPEAGQDKMVSYRHTKMNYHIHSHGENWTIHEDEHAAATMKLRAWFENKKSQALGGAKSASSSVFAPVKEFLSGIPHILQEGIPGAYYYLKGKLTGAEDMATRLKQEMRPEYAKFINKLDTVQPKSIMGSIRNRIVSGRDDVYNTIEGLRHGGEAQRKRREMTDFGSGWVRKALSKGIDAAKVAAAAGKLGTGISGMEASQFGEKILSGLKSNPTEAIKFLRKSQGVTLSGERFVFANEAFAKGGFGEVRKAYGLKTRRVGAFKTLKQGDVPMSPGQQFAGPAAQEAGFPLSSSPDVNKFVRETSDEMITTGSRYGISPGTLAYEAKMQQMAREQMGSVVPEVYGVTERGLMTEFAGSSLAGTKYEASATKWIEERWGKDLTEEGMRVRHFDPQIKNITRQGGKYRMIDYGLAAESGPISPAARSGFMESMEAISRKAKLIQGHKQGVKLAAQNTLRPGSRHTGRAGKQVNDGTVKI